MYSSSLGHAVSQLVLALRYKPGRSRVRFLIVSLEFFIDMTLLAALWPRGLTQSLTEMITRNISWRKGGRCVRLRNLPPSCADSLEIW